jgi:hypothetical protein
MDWFGLREAGVLLLVAWMWLSVGIAPRRIGNQTALAAVTLVGGSAILWGFNALAPRSPYYLMGMSIVVILSALLAVFHSELIFRRQNGYWRFVGRRSDGQNSNLV